MKLSLIGTLGCAVALGNTAPFLLISGTEDVPTINENTVGEFEASLADELAECRYDSYIFAQVNGVTERNINGDTMPRLRHLLDKAAGYHFLPVVQDFAEYRAHAENTVQTTCGATPVDVAFDGSFKLYDDLEPRVFELDLGIDPRAADVVLGQVIGHLPSSNFIVVLRSIPPAQGESAAVAATKNTESNLFTDYIFFSPGIFMGTMISLMVVSVLIIALGWLQSLLVSYKAFEKQPEKQ